MKKVLIIGANSAFAKSAIPFLKSNYEIITVGRKNCDVIIDIDNEFDIPQNIDIVINFAAHFGYLNDDEVIQNDIQTNILGTFNILKASKKSNIKHLILISSIFAKLSNNSPYFNSYALTKKYADELSHYYCAANKMNVTILRPSQIYGSSNNFRKHQQFFYVMMDKAQNGEDITIYGTNNATRNFINVADLSQILFKVIEEKVYGVFDCIYPQNTTILEIAQTAQKIFDKGGKIKFLKDKPDVTDNSFECDNNLYQKINYYPQITLKEGIELIKKSRQTERR